MGDVAGVLIEVRAHGGEHDGELLARSD